MICSECKGIGCNLCEDGHYCWPKLVTLLLGVLLSSTAVQAKSWAKVRNLSLEVTGIADKREYYMPEFRDKWHGGVMLRWDIDLGKRFYWNNQTYFDGTASQVRHIGWKYEQGVKLFDNNMQIFYQHHSEHVAERKYDRNFPLDNRFGVRINLIN